jgi:hypothetical protein
MLLVGGPYGIDLAAVQRITHSTAKIAKIRQLDVSTDQTIIAIVLLAIEIYLHPAQVLSIRSDYGIVYNMSKASESVPFFFPATFTF